MNIQKIIYETTRQVFNVEDKLSIATLFLFCEKQGAETFAELLYCPDTGKFIKELNEKYREFDVNFDVRLSNFNVKNAFKLTKQKVIEQEDKDGFYKAVYEKDPFALAIVKITNAPFVLNNCKEDINTITKKKNNQNEYYDLFCYLHDEFGVALTDTEMQDIESEFEKGNLHEYLIYSHDIHATQLQFVTIESIFKKIKTFYIS